MYILLTGYLKTVLLKNSVCLIFDFVTPKGLKIIPSDREEQERSDKRVEKRQTFFEYLQYIIYFLCRERMIITTMMLE